MRFVSRDENTPGMHVPSPLTSGVICALVAAGCASHAQRADDIARAAGLSKQIVAGQAFRHATFAAAGDAEALWIYIEGDGVPWLTEHVPSADPTPRVLVALEAMAAGPRPALFVGRPCYFDTNPDPGCGPLLWTHRRFAPEVIASMASALRSAIAAREWSGRPIVFVGFSGGGTLATLLAAEFDRACALITMASPLDIDEWTRARGYSQLEGSVNPAALPALPAHIRQLHLRGGRDRVVDAHNGSAYRQRNPRAEFRIVEGNAHGRDWLATWKALAPELGRFDGACAGGSRR